MVQAGGPALDKLERGLRQILRVRRRTDLIVDDLHGPFGLGPPEEAFQEAVPIRAEQPARTDDADVVGVELKQGLFTGKAALAAQGDRIGLVLLGVRGVLAAVENLIRAVVDEESGRAFDQPAEEGRKAAVDREGFLWLFFSRGFRVSAYGI